MKPEDAQRDRKALEIFGRAVEMASAEARAGYLEGACGGDESLKARVKALLAHHVQDSFLQQPAAVMGLGATAVMPIVEKPGDCIGRYKLLQQIGEGGCGVVYMAEQEEPVRRRVALKVIKLGMDTKSVIARFEAERQALAMMDHPNIAKVLDAGATETGRPYFVMELVRGVKITDYCDQNNLSTRERLDLFIQVCHAIQHAHQKGIIHRDIKPSNILVSLHDDVAVPKVIDFGIAKAMGERLTDKTFYTQFEQFMGTPAYMSPEQAGRSDLDIDTRSDIYALGVLLYELLAGRPPFDPKQLAEAGLEEMVRCIREEEPVRPSTRLSRLQQEELTTMAQRRGTEPPKLIHLLRGDLDWIVMKCLEKNRTRRYEAANALALDIERHLNNEPVAARPPSAAYKVQKFVRRNKVMVTAGTAVAAALVLGMVVSTWQAVRASRLRIRAEANEQKALQAQANEAKQRLAAEQQRGLAQANELLARQNAYAADMNLAFRSFDENDLGTAMDLLEQQRPKPGQPDLRGWEWRYLWKQCQSDELFLLGEHSGGVTAVSFAPDGNTLASGSYDRTVIIWDLEARRPLAKLPHGARVSALVFSPDGKWLTTSTSPGDDPVRIWDTRTWKLASTLPELKFMRNLAFSPDGKMLAGNGEQGGTLWEMSSRRQVGGFGGKHAILLDPAVAFSPTDQLVAYHYWRGDQPVIGLYDIRIGKELGALAGPEITSFAFSPNGRLIASGAWDRGVRLWDVAARELIRTLTNHTAFVSSVVFLPDGSMLATAGSDQRIRLWDTVNWQEVAALKGHRSAISALACSGDGKRLASGDVAGTIRLWSAIPKAGETAAVRRRWDFLQAHVGPAPDEWGLLYEDGRLVFWNTLELREWGRVPALFAPSNTVAGAISAGGKLVAQSLSDRTVRVWETRSREETARFGPLGETVFALRFSRDSQYLLTLGESLLSVWRLGTAQPTACWTNDLGPVAMAALFSPDARYVCTGHQNGTASLWALDGSGSRILLERHQNAVLGIAISPVTRLVATICDDKTLVLWDLKTGKERVLGGQLLAYGSVVFSPDGSRVAAGTEGGQIDIWDTGSFRKLATLRGSFGHVNFLAFSADGNTLSSITIFPGYTEYEIRLWRGASPKEMLTSDEVYASGH
jgi:WD40 repeat protein